MLVEGSILTSLSEPLWKSQRPKDRMYIFAIDRITILEDFAKRNCRAANCGEKDEGGDVAICSGPLCGEKRLEEWHQRELQCLRDLKTFIEWYERAEIAKAAAADKASKGRKS